MFRPSLALSLVALVSLPAAAQADIIVQRAPGASAAAVRSDAGVQLVDSLPIARTQVVAADHGQSQADALAALNADPDVLYAEADQTVHALTNDTYWGLQADLPLISAPQAWTLSKGAGVTVGVVDTGAELDHPDLAGQFAVDPGESGNGREHNGIDDDGDGVVDDYRGWDFVEDDNDPSDQNGHGTHVAGTIAAVADNATGVAGVAPGAKVLPLRALGPDGSGSMSDIAAAFALAGRLG